MIVHRIKTTLPNFKFESIDHQKALARLSEVQRTDPTAKLVNVPVSR